MSDSLTLAELSAAVSGGAAALRSITILQPVEGDGGKVFPATYAEGKYATEKRRLAAGDGGAEREVDCVLLNSVQSEANHAELALLDAVRRGLIQLPLIEVDFAEANAQFQKPLPNLTSLEVPHRLADAILRDSVLADGTRFSKSAYAERWRRSNLWNATAIYELCPTALVFGMWGSPDKPGGLGAKFERAYISEIVAVDTVAAADRMGFRVDPLSASSKVMLARSGDGFEIASEGTKSTVKPSALNHGNVVFPKSGSRLLGGVRCRFAEQTTVVSLGALRKLRFPVDGKSEPKSDDAARTALAALALCAGVLTTERGVSLRSRCNLRPVAPRVWEILDRPGMPAKTFTMTGDDAIALFKDAAAASMPWMKDTLSLKPTPELVDLVRRSQEIMAAEGEEKES